MTEVWRFTDDGVTPDEFERVQRWLHIVARRMSARQVLAVADGLHELYVSRCEMPSAGERPAGNPRRRWTDRALALRRMDDAEFSEVFGEAMRAAMRDKVHDAPNEAANDQGG